MKIPIIALILQGIPEQIAVATLAFVIANISLSWKRIGLIGVVVAISSYILRLFPFTFGIHTVLVMGLLFILLLTIGKGNLNASLLASLFSFLGLILAETVSISIQTNLFGLSIETILSNNTVRILTGWLHIVLLLCAAMIIFRVKKRKNYKV